MEQNFLNCTKKILVLLKYLCLTGIVAFTGLWLAFGYAAQLVCNFVGFLYPAYASMHALESASKDDDTKWLTYWVVFAIFSVVEYFADTIVGWFPLYWLVKVENADVFIDLSILFCLISVYFSRVAYDPNRF